MVSHRDRLDRIRKRIYLARFENELNDSKKFEISNERTEQLQQIIECIKTNNKKTVKPVEYRDRASTTGTSYTGYDDYFSQLDTIAYKKRWNSLKSFHKEEKLKEFAKSFGMSTEVTNILLEELMKAFDAKKIHTEKSVSYDQTSMTIKEIRGVEVDSDNEKFTVLKRKIVKNSET